MGVMAFMDPWSINEQKYFKAMNFAYTTAYLDNVPLAVYRGELLFVSYSTVLSIIHLNLIDLPGNLSPESKPRHQVNVPVTSESSV